jgi:hypothetical protein
MDATESTEEQKFLEQQYTALRAEIEQAADRAFKIFAASVLVVPTGLTLGGVASADNNVLPLIKMLLPLLLLAFYAMYSAQLFSTRRAGLYIKSYIEPTLLHRTRGWESWVGDRRYAYDAQLNVAFILLSFVYYLGTVYLAAKAEETPLVSYLKGFLSTENGYLSSEIMLSMFYSLAGLVMIFLVLLVPLRQLKEEERIEQVDSGDLAGTPEQLHEHFRAKLEKRKLILKSWRPHFKERGLVKRYHYHAEGAGYIPKSRHVRLTIGKGLRSITPVAGIVTMIALLLWAAMPIYRFYDRAAQPPGIVMILTLVSLLFLLVLLYMLYYYFIGRNIGAKIDISFRLASQAADGDWTRYSVQTSLDKDEETYQWWKEILKEMVDEKGRAKPEDRKKPAGAD